MSGLGVEEVLAAPRGRGLCWAVAARLEPDLRRRMWYAAEAPTDLGLRSELVAALRAVDAFPVVSWPDEAFLEPVDEAVCSAMYWQEPLDEDRLLGVPEIGRSLAGIAAAIVAAPGTAWWDEPADLTALRHTVKELSGRPAVPPQPVSPNRLLRWREQTLADERRAAAERPADVRAPVSGLWWSTPAMSGPWTTTRPLPGLGSLSLVWEEDEGGAERAAVFAVETTRTPRVWEVRRPEDWSRLVSAYPLEVTHARRHDWYRTTGRDGRWLIPDWPAVAGDWDAVHVSVDGYLATATRALPTDDSACATMLAGWDPDQTWWLTDAVRVSDPDPQWWVRRGDTWAGA